MTSAAEMAPESAAAAVEAFFLKALGPLNNLPKMMTAIKAFRLVNSDRQLPVSLRQRLLGDLLVKTFDKDEARAAGRADVIERLLSLEVRSVVFVLSFDCGRGCRTCTKVGFVRSSTRTRCGLLFTSSETFHFRSLLHPSATLVGRRLPPLMVSIPLARMSRSAALCVLMWPVQHLSVCLVQDITILTAAGTRPGKRVITFCMNKDCTCSVNNITYASRCHSPLMRLVN